MSKEFSLCSLSLDGDIIGTRICGNLKWYDTPVLLNEVTDILNSLNLSFEISKYVYKGRIKGDEVIFEYEYMISATLNSKEDLKKELRKYSKYLKRLDEIFPSFRCIVSGEILRGLEYHNLTSMENRICSARFVGGLGAWSESEDICDASVPSDKVTKVINQAVKRVNKKYKVNIEWYTGEKAWTYFELK